LTSPGLDAAIITDHDNMKVSYGVFPFQNLLKYSIVENSIATYGFKNYLFEIDQLDQMYPNTLIIPGIEAVPFYFWEGSPFKKDLKLRNWHTHLLVVGLNDVKAYKKLPSIAKGIGPKIPSGDIKSYLVENILHIFKIIILFLLFILSLLFVVRKRKSKHYHRTPRYRFSWKVLFLVIILGVILKFEYPFFPPLYDQYHGEQGGGPFQRLIDYVNENNGMVFWAHPEVNHDERLPVKLPFLEQEVLISTEAYPQYCRSK